MNNETQRRIKAYKAALPELRERVIAVALLLAMSASMLATASYAWITLSTAPEVSGMATTVAANGNLEIALVEPEGNKPPESGINDSSSVEGRSMSEANITWGNLVNLSDPVYGLDHMALRPALLSFYDLTEYPLRGATYGKDGRVIDTQNLYQYASWKTLGSQEFFDAKNVEYGVRAITSVTYENITGNAVYENQMNLIQKKYDTDVVGAYNNMLNGTTTLGGTTKKAVDALETMINVYAQEQVDELLAGKGMGSYTPADYSSHIWYLREMMKIVQGVLTAEGEYLLRMANLQVYLANPDMEANPDLGQNYFSNLSEVSAHLAEVKRDPSKSLGVNLESLTTHLEDVVAIQTSLNEINADGLADKCAPGASNRPEVPWSAISTTVDRFVNIGTAELNGVPIVSLNLDTIGSVKDGQVVIKGGILTRIEQRIGDIMKQANIFMSVKVKAIITIEVDEQVMTSAAPKFLFNEDVKYTYDLSQSGEARDATAKDTYGMALDMWLRTNAADSVVTLEGTTEYIEQDEKRTDKNGSETLVYDLLLEEGETVVVYKLVEDGTDVWYYADNHVPLEEGVITDDNRPTVTRKINIVSGYHGENRIWENWDEMVKAGLVPEDSTTQGAGSCFTFYADPSEQTRILDLLRAFNITFIDKDGNELGTAQLNTANFYAVNGKVTVPLEMVSGQKYVDELGVEQIGLMPLVQNEATWITAIIYLNGRDLKNENVLAAGEIQGRLNIQFGSSVGLTHMEDDVLEQEYRTVTAVAVSGEQTSPNVQNTPITFEYTGTDNRVTVTLTVVGEQPERISGFFQRIINQTQGSRSEVEDFKLQENGTWTATFKLKTPGEYAMRSVIVDGVEYNFDICPEVLIEGLAIGEITMTPSSGIIMTSDNTFPVTVRARINADADLMPGQVRAQLRSTTGEEVNALMSYDSETGTWVGTADIRTSGTYTLEYLVMDGEYREISDKAMIIVSLGMKTMINGTLPSDPYVYAGPDPTTEKNPTIEITADILDGGDKLEKNLPSVQLWYLADGSSLPEDGLYAELKWVAERGRYVGNMTIDKAGEFRFGYLVVTRDGKTSLITKATAPVFSIGSPEPPVYHDRIPVDEYQVALNGQGALKVQLDYARSGQVYGELYNAKSRETTYVQAVRSNNQSIPGADGKTILRNDFTFNVGDGDWYLQNIYIKGTYVDGVNYPTTGEINEGYRLEVPKAADGQSSVRSYVVATLLTSITKAGVTGNYTGEEYGFEGTNITGKFMDTYTESGVTLNFTDYYGQPLQGLTEVSWEITHTGNDKAYGGYTGNVPGKKMQWSKSNQTAVGVLTPNDAKAPTSFTAEDYDFYYAGDYTSKFTVKAKIPGSENETTMTITGPSYTVKSVKPTVSVSVSDTTTSFNTKITWKQSSGLIGNKKLVFTETDPKKNVLDTANNEVTVYASTTVGGTNNSDASFNRPQVTFTAAGLNDTSVVTFSIPKNGSATAKSVSITGNGSASVTLGNIVSVYSKKFTFITYNVSGFAGHGDVTIDQITVTHGGAAYTVYLDNPIKIHNPSSVNQTS